MIKVLPLPLRRIIGDLSDTQKVLIGLDLRPARTQREGSRTDRAHAAGLGLPTAEGHRGEIDDLRARVREVEETKKAIRGGEVDAVGRQFRGFLEASPDAVIVVDQTGLINFASNRIEAMFGYLPDELVGKPLSVLMPERYRDLHAGHLDRFMNDPRPRMMGAGLELRALRKDGSEFPFSVIASDVGRPLADLARHFTDGDLLVDARTVLSNLVPLSCEIEVENGAFYSCRILPYRTKDNRIQGVVITFVDVTAHKRAEDALNAAKVQAESANLGKSRFLAAASHDLRQPLQTLILLQGRLAMILKDKEALGLVARSKEALTGMANLLNTLLDINQLEAGVISPEFVDFPLNKLLERLRSEFGYPMRANGLDWRVLPCRRALRTDPRLLEQMIRNLLSNAVKYTRKGGVLLGCRQRGNKLRIEIWDTGIGIPQGQLRAIFEEFHQVDNPARESNLGLGLGLAIVQRLGNLLGHAVDVRSRAGRGSVFAIEVPLAERPDVPQDIERVAEATAARKGSILIVEDDPAVRDSIEILLQAVGHRTTAAADGKEAIELVAHADAQPDVVIVDYNLPGGMTGLQVLARLRKMIGLGLHALVLTGDISSETLSEITLQGYVHRGKPIRAEDLLGLIGSFLAERP